MILWINGAFGAGKTQTANALCRRIPDSFLYDPEEVGFLLRRQEPKALQKDNFQDEGLFRRMNRELLLHLAEDYDGVIVVPMTLTSAQYYREIITEIRDAGCTVFHVLLYPPRETVKKRLHSRLEGSRSWAWRQTESCYAAFEDPIFENRLDNAEMSVPETAEAVAALAKIPLLPRENPVKAFFHRVDTQRKAIRR